MKRTRIGMCLSVMFCFALTPVRQAQVEAAPAIAGAQTTLRILPTTLNFGSVPIGAKSPAQTVHLRNPGTTTVRIFGISISGTNARDFGQINNCKSSLAAGASCHVSITFKPTASGARTAALRITDNAAGSPQSVSLNGTGVGGRCTPEGMQCPPQAPPCCPGLVCVPASTRAFCEPATKENPGAESWREQSGKIGDSTRIFNDVLEAEPAAHK